MTPVVLVPDAVAIVLLAPAMSIVAATRRDRHASATLLPALGAVLVLVVVSIAATLGTSSSASSAIAMPHATLAAAALASAALGALCGRFFDDVLDAAAVSGVLVVAATFALLVAGDLVVGLPTAVVDAGLTASPLVAMASAAEFDLLRSDAWYHASPIAHRSFSYPLWSHATGSYILVSIICAIVFIRKTERSS